jgi:hypothetical protein
MSGHGHGHHSLKEVLLDVSQNDAADGRQPFEAVADAAIVECAITTSKSRVVFIVIILDILTTVFIMLGAVCHFELSEIEPNLLSTNATIGFNIGTSMIDVVIVDTTRWLVLFLCFVVVLSCCRGNDKHAVLPYHQQLLDSLQRRMPMPRPSSPTAITVQSLGWWILFTWTTWSITKVSMLDWKSGWPLEHSGKMWCVVLCALFSIVELKYTGDVVKSQRRASQLHTLLLTDLAAHMDATSGSDETKTATINIKLAKDDSIEDPRSRFFEDPEKKRAQLLKPQSDKSMWDNMSGLWKIMQAYAWPSGCTSKLRILITFVVMAGSKTCAILTPMYIGQATQRLSDEGVVPWHEIILYCSLQFGSVALAQYQKIVYLGVKQHAFAEIATTTFRHLHSLSLDWHLQKKMGTVLRIMDRGISSADSVMNYLVLYLLPSIVQAFIVFGLFYVKFDSPELAGAAFLSFVAYCVVTIQITMWRKKFRKATNKHDNKYHDLATDSLINFETVKYFANEEHEISQFRTSVEQYQKHNIATQVSLAVLNSVQQLDIQLTTMVALMLSATTILHQTSSSAPSANIGAFVSVNAYILQLYAPLSFLGSIYSTVVQAFVDMGNLSEMLTVSPDVSDAPNARALSLHAPRQGATIEFQNVRFSYPSQPSKGLRGVSFVVQPGTTTAIVGKTGAGKFSQMNPNTKLNINIYLFIFMFNTTRGVYFMILLSVSYTISFFLCLFFFILYTLRVVSRFAVSQAKVQSHVCSFVFMMSTVEIF